MSNAMYPGQYDPYGQSSSLPGNPVGYGEGGGFTGFLSRLLNGNQSPYTALGDPSDVTNVNPYTDSFFQQLQGQGNNLWNSLMGPGSGNQFYPQMQQALGQIDPQAANNYFINNAAGNYRDIAEQNFAQYNTANQAVADRLSNQAVQNIASQFANRGPGGLRSSGAMQAISEGAINPLLQSNAQIGQMIGGQAGQMQGQGMNNLFNAYNTANQQRLAGIGQMLGSADQRQALLGNLFGSLSGMQAGMAGPEWWQPTYANNPNYLGMGDILNAGAQVAGIALGGPGGSSGGGR